MNSPLIRGFLFAATVLSMAAGAWPLGENSGTFAGLSTEQIVEQLQRHDQWQTRELRVYKSLRHYKAEYRGFSKQLEAKMDVEVDYSASSGKNLTILSQSGSKFLLDKVLKRAVDSEKEAFQNRKSTALTSANYRFKQVGRESVAGRPAYILDVEPLVPSKFLYRGRIWVDAADFATVKMETEPAKSPSFWISRTIIHYTGVKAEGFWMPQEVRSETSVRIGGEAVLTINYGNYQIAPSPLPEALADLGR